MLLRKKITVVVPIQDSTVCYLDSDQNILTFKVKIPKKFANLLLSMLLLVRRIRFGSPFRRIPLTQGMYAIVDPDDYETLCFYNWHAKKGPRTYYAVHSITNGKKQKRKNLYMHQLVLKVPPNMYCDHINQNGLDNRKQNLRPATHTQNVWNRRKFKKPNPTSKYIGVDWSKSLKKFRARITVNGKRLHLGSFDTPEQAAKAYDSAAKKFHGQFASTNFK